MPVLHVEDRVVERVLARERHVEIERHVAAPEQEEEAGRI